MMYSQHTSLHMYTYHTHTQTRTGSYCSCFDSMSHSFLLHTVLGVDPCMTTPCKNGATCLNVEAFEYTCVCVDGYTGMNCENDSDMCRHTKPCKHNATCLNTGPNAYECHCREGFYGRQCKLNTTSNDSNSKSRGDLHRTVNIFILTLCRCILGSFVY